MIKILSPKFHEFLTCSDLLATKSYLRFSLNMTRCISRNSHNCRFLFDWFKLNVENFTVENWTNSLKLELLSVILLHSMSEFEEFFSFTYFTLLIYWSFESFWHFVLKSGESYAASWPCKWREIQIVDAHGWQKQRIFGQISKVQWLHINPY